MGDFSTTMSAIGATGALGATIASIGEASAGEKASLEQINLEQKQRQLQLTQQKISVYDAVQKTVDRQEAESTTRGISMDSPSFNAIQRQTMNIGSENLQNIKTEQEMTDYNAKAQRENVKNSMYAQIFGSVGKLGMSFAQLASGMPTSPPTSSTGTK